MGTYDWLNDISPSNNNVDNEINKAADIQVRTDTMSYPKSAALDLANSLTFGLSNLDENNIDLLGNQDQTVVGNTLSIPASIFEGAAIGKGLSVASDIGGSLVRKATTSLFFKNADELTSDILKNSSKVSLEPTVTKSQKILSGLSFLGGNAFTPTVQTNTYIDDNGMLQQSRDKLFSKEWWNSYIQNLIPTAILSTGIGLGIKYFKSKDNTINDIKKDDYTSQLNLDNDKDYNTFTKNLVSSVGSKFELTNKDSILNSNRTLNGIHTNTFDIKDNGDLIEDTHLLSDNETKNYVLNKINQIKDDKNLDLTNKENKIKLLLNTSSYSFSKLNGEDKTKIINNIFKEPDREINILSNQDSTYQIDKSHIYHNSSKLGSIRLTNKNNSDVNDIVNNTDLKIKELNNAINNNDNNKADNILTDIGFEKDDIDNIKNILSSSDKSIKTDLLNKINGLLKPQKYYLKQYGDDLTLGFHSVVNKNNGLQLATKIRKENRTFFNMSDDEIKANKNIISMQRANNIIKLYKNSLEEITNSDKKITSKNKNKIMYTAINNAYQQLLKNNEQIMNNHIVKDIPINFDDNNNININDIDNTRLKDYKEPLTKALNDFIDKNIQNKEENIVELNKGLKNNLFTKKQTIGSIINLANSLKDNVDLNMFDTEELRKGFGNLTKNINDLSEDIKEHISNIDANIDMIFNNIFGIKSNNISFSESEKIINLLEDNNFLKQLIETYSDKEPTLNNFIASITYKKNNNLFLKQEFKNAINLATKKTLFSALSSIDHSISILDKNNETGHIYLKQNDINPDNYYSNIIKKSIDILGISSNNISEFDSFKNNLGNIINAKLGNQNLLKRVLNPIYIEPTSIENKLSLSDNLHQLILFEKYIDKKSKSQITVNSKNSSVSMSSGSVNQKQIYKINGIEVDKNTYKAFKNNIRNIKTSTINTYFNDVLKLNDLLEPIDNINNFISNKNKLNSISNINEYLSNKSVATTGIGEKYMTLLMGNTEIRFRDDEIQEKLDNYLSVLFSKFNIFLSNEDVDLFKEIYNKFEINDNLKLDVDINKFNSINQIKNFFGDKYDSIIEKIGEFKREYDIIKNFKNMVKDNSVRAKIFMSESGRFMYDSIISYQSNKWSKHFLNFTSTDNYNFKDIDEAKTFIKSAIRTGIDELGYEPIDDNLRKAFTLDNGKFDVTKSSNDNYKEHLQLLFNAINNINESDLTSEQIRYYYPLKKMSEMFNKYKNPELKRIKTIENIVSVSKPIVELDGSQNVVGTINTLLSISDNATGINGHQEKATIDTYERFLQIVTSASKNSVYSDVLDKILGNAKRNDVKKSAQSHIYGESPINTATSLLVYFLNKKLFDDNIINNNKKIGINRLNLLYDIILGSNNNYEKMLPTSDIESIIKESNKVVDKFNKMKIVNNSKNNGLKDAKQVETTLEALVDIYNGNKQALLDDLNKFGISSDDYIDKLENLSQVISSNPEIENKFIGFIGKINSAISSSISNKDFLETLGLKLTSSLKDMVLNIKNKINNNPELKIIYYKSIIDKILENTKNNNVNSSADLFDSKLLSMFYNEINKNIINEDYIKTLAKSINKKTNFGNILEKYLTEKDEMFSKFSQLRNTIETVYKLGESLTFLKLNDKVKEPNSFIKKIFKEINIDDDTKKSIITELKESFILNNKEPTYKEIGDILYRYGVSPLRSDSFLKDSQIPFMQTPSGRKLLYITEKSVNLDDKTGMQTNGFAIINKPLTYFIQGIESDSLSKASMVSYINKDINGVIHRFDAVYGKESLSVAKNLNKMYSAMFNDKKFFDRIKYQTDNMITIINKYKNTPEFNDLSKELAKIKILINEGKLSKGSMEKIDKLQQEYKNFFENNISVKYKLKDGELKPVYKDKRTKIESSIDSISQIKENNLKLIKDGNDIIINQFTNGLKHFEIKEPKGIC